MPRDVGTRADVIVTRLTGLSRSYVAARSRAGGVDVNGNAAKPSRILEEGDVLRYAIDPPPVLRGDAAGDRARHRLRRRRRSLVVNKPAGMVSHPAHGSPDGTLVNALLAHVGTLPGEPIRGGLVHRLDRDTSGLLLAAKTEAALATLGPRDAEALYRTRIPRIWSKAFRATRGHDSRRARPRRAQPAALRDAHRRQTAVTHYACARTMRNAAELEFRLETGRTHQIRVHLAALGHPIVNDPLYGRPDSRLALPGQALHAWKLAFKHPVTKEHLAFEVEPPADYLAALDVLRG